MGGIVYAHILRLISVVCHYYKIFTAIYRNSLYSSNKDYMFVLSIY